MSMQSAITDHLNEGDLIRILDDEAEAEELAVWTSHLRSCESCRRLRDEIGQQSAWFRSAAPLLDGGATADDLTKARAQAALRSSLLEREQRTPLVTAAPHSNGTGGRKSAQSRNGLYYRLAAAGIGVILFVALAVEPVRAWIMENVLSVASRVEDSARENVSPPSPEATPTAPVRFSVQGPVFRIELDQRQREGTLTIRLTSDDQVSARIIGRADETLVVLPSGLSGLRVGNATESGASYIVELPASEIREVVVRAAGRPLGSRTLSAVGEEIELDLATEAVVP